MDSNCSKLLPLLLSLLLLPLLFATSPTESPPRVNFVPPPTKHQSLQTPNPINHSSGFAAQRCNQISTSPLNPFRMSNPSPIGSLNTKPHSRASPPFAPKTHCHHLTTILTRHHHQCTLPGMSFTPTRTSLLRASRSSHYPNPKPRPQNLKPPIQNLKLRARYMQESA